MNFNLNPIDITADNAAALLLATNKDRPELALQMDFPTGGLRNLVFKSEQDMLDYIEAYNKDPENDGYTINMDDVRPVPASAMSPGDPAYLVERKEA